MISPEQFRFFSEMVRSSSGISLVTGKEYLMETRLNELARVLGLRDLDALYRKARLEMTSRLKEQIVEAMTTNETYFFRDRYPFEVLQGEVIPQFLKLNAATKSLRVWSAACSTGQEPYSVAMLIQERFPSLSSWNVKILATDISQQVIEKGQNGRYTQVEANRGLAITLLVKYFHQQGAFWIINERLRNMVCFRRMNLLDPFGGLGSYDVILCRYVLIYFDEGTKQNVLEKLVRALKPGGYLFLGATEAPMSLPPIVERRGFGRTTCWQKTG